MIAHNLLDVAQLTFVRSAMDASLRAGRMKSNQNSILPQGARNEYSAIGAEALLMQCQMQIENIVGCSLIPAYALWRIYGPAASLLRHVDRSSCEISVSMPICADPEDTPWPIYIQDLQGNEVAVMLKPGEGIVYQGCRIEHWREPFQGRYQKQVFLHYVIKDGDRADCAFDGRSSLGIVLNNRGSK